jgi:uncharacterized protein (TIGR03435 family)
MMKTSIVTTAIACVVAAVVAGAQGANPAFEVATIKANHARAGIRGHAFPGDRFEATNVPVRDLILIAYGEGGRLLPESLQRGGPAWVDTDRYDVTGKVAAGDDVSVQHKQLMLRRLLADRFHFAAHEETIEAPMYRMVLARAGALGPNLRRSNDACGAGDAGSVPTPHPGEQPRCVRWITPPGVLTLRGQSMPDIAYVLTLTLDRAVDDQTGLTGRYDADAEFNPDGLPDWAPAPPGSPNRDAPSFFTALQQDLGLRLEATRGPVTMLMIERLDRPTAD